MVILPLIGAKTITLTVYSSSPELHFSTTLSFTMLLHGNNIFTVRFSDKTSTIVAGDYAEVCEFATKIVAKYQQTANIFCHGTDSIWSTITPEFVTAIASV